MEVGLVERFSADIFGRGEFFVFGGILDKGFI